MPDTDYKVLWTDNALKGSVKIRNYLRYKFSQKEINNFYAKLLAFEKTVIKFPTLYIVSSSEKQIRRAVLNKNLSVYYRINEFVIEVLAVLDNRMDQSELHD